eukprot:6743289-Lingulodinium_polyedra.AAC.1
MRPLTVLFCLPNCVPASARRASAYIIERKRTPGRTLAPHGPPHKRNLHNNPPINRPFAKPFNARTR